MPNDASSPQNEEKLLDYLRRATLDLRRTQQELSAVQAREQEPIAIVGMACRYPGGVASPEDLWRLLSDGVDGVSPFPTDRGWDLDGLYDPDPDAHGKTYVQSGGFLEGVDQFDPALFGISPREALMMDPHQRLVMELAWETFERAGIDPLSTHGGDIGTFIGTNPLDYHLGETDTPEGDPGHRVTGSAPSIISGRIAYTFGLEGPAVTVDTACSSSLVALHLAVNALRLGDCSMALAGGVAVLSLPAGFVGFSHQRAMSKDGRCRAFSADADGMGMGEGAGMLLVERLSDARRKGHPVLAVVRGSAINQDGASNGLTAPNGPSQQRVIEAALANARLTADHIDAVEAHGTGTTLGDPIEAQAIIATYGQNRPADRPIWLGSLKSNVAHTQAAAGVGGVIKSVLAMRHGILPKTLHADQPSTKIDWDAGAVALLGAPTPWPDRGQPRRMGVSSFGVSGTNAHVILEQVTEELEPAPAADGAEPAALPEGTPVPWALSGHTPKALREQAGRLLNHLDDHPEEDLGAVAHALLTTRAALDHRAVAVGADHAELRRALRAIADDTPEAAENAAVGGVSEGIGQPVFVFPGQGSQWLGMAVELLDSTPRFAEEFHRAAAPVEALVDWSAQEVLRGPEDSEELARVDVVQPLLYVVMVALAGLWKSFGVRPGAVVGHSQGEIAAAVVAGALTPEDGARIVVIRSRLIRERLAGRGGMASVALGREATEELLARWDDRLTVAAANGSGSTVIAGETAAVDALIAACEAEEIRIRRIPVDYASHSPQVDEIAEELRAALADIRPRSCDVPFHSTVERGPIDTAGLDADYWVRNLRQPVEFADVVARLTETGQRVFVESSPHPVLMMAVAETAGADTLTVGSLRRGDGGLGRFLLSLGEAWSWGVDVDWSVLPLGGARRHVHLPTYAFQRQRYWAYDHAARDAVEGRAAGPVDQAEAEFWDAVERQDVRALSDALAFEGDELGGVLPALASWRRRRREQSALESWRYRIDWNPLPSTAVGRLTGTWLLALPADADQHAWAEGAAGAIEAHGAATARLTVPAGSGREELRRLVADAVTAVGDTPIAGVLSLLALDESPAPDVPAVTSGTLGNLALIQALGDEKVTAALWFATRGAVSVGAADPLTHPEQAATWGLGRAAATEYPHRWGGLVDLPESVDERSGARLAALLAGELGDPREDQVAVRAAGVHAARLTRMPRPGSTSDSGWRPPRGTVLITGGTGGIGGHVARWLAREGAEHLLLTSRRGADAPGAAELADELTALGARVTVAACDVADRSALAGLLADLPAELPLGAVFHTAGVLDDVILDTVTPESMGHVAAGKALAARHLHELTAGADLAAFVLFSSFASLLPNVGQGNYTAANNYLDALALHRRAEGLTATSVQWGSWGGGGLTEGELGERLSADGVPQMAPQLAIAGLARALGDDDGLVAVVDVDWNVAASPTSVSRIAPLITTIPEARRAFDGGEKAAAGQGTDLAVRLAALGDADRDRELADLVRTQAAMALGHADGEAVAGTRAFKDLGVDSMIAVNLRNSLSRTTGLPLPATLVFDHPTPNELAAFLKESLFGRSEQPRPAALPAAGTPDDDDPIAIVGMACRFPGGVTSPEDLWQLVAEGRDAIAEFPTDRGWDIDGIYDPDPEAPGKTYVREGGFLDDAGRFDAGFFGISPREALAMDPQQRLLLEVSWEALERAGLAPAALQGSPVGVFIGGGQRGYIPSDGELPEGTEGFLMTGNASSVMSGRISYTLGLEGPAVTVDTACSSSLVALHQAAQAVRQGECGMALVGGVTIVPDVDLFVEFSRQRGLAPDGRCKAFADTADGTAWAEGVGVLVVERLSSARAAGHPVLAVVRGSAVNQDGASNGLTAPNGPSQQRVIRQALANARLTPQEIDAVEAHGTGTSLGDPIEAQALMAVYGQDRADREPLWLGSVKSNIGHTQAAAGAASIIKMVMAMRSGSLPGTLHVDEPSSHIDWSAGQVELLTEARPWPERDEPRRAGVSSFGISGTNVHVVLEEAPAEEPAEEAAESAAPARPDVLPWVFSGRGERAVPAQARRIAAFLRDGEGRDPLDVAWSLAATRSAFEHRAVVVGGSAGELLTGVDAVASGAAHPGVVTGAVRGDDGRTGVLFAGQGAQRLGMGRELYEAFPAFARAWDEASAVLNGLLPAPLHEVVWGDDAAALDDTRWAQPALFVYEVALYRLVESWGVRPDFVAGHSVGEIAAAHVAGVLSLADAARLVAARGRLMRALPEGGAMVAVAAPEDEVRAALAGHESTAGIAAVNGPEATVVSGEEAVVVAVAERFAARGVKTRRLRVSHAFHSPLMEPMLDEFRAVVEGLSFGASTLGVVSTLTGERATADTWADADYWVRHVREPVRFADAVRVLEGERVRHLVEVGPDGTLSGMAAQCVSSPDAVRLAALARKDRAEPGALVEGLAHAWVAGATVDWAAICADGQRVELPTYSFQGDRYWLSALPGSAGSVTELGLRSAGHALLGAATTLADGRGALLTGRLSPAAHPWARESPIDGVQVLPEAALLDVLVRAGDEVGCDRIAELTVHTPLVIPERGGVRLQIVVDGADESGLRPFSLYGVGDEEGDGAAADAEWTRHATGVLGTGGASHGAELAAWPPAGAEPVDLAEVTAHAGEAGEAGEGMEPRERVATLRALWRHGDDVLAEVVLAEGASTAGFGLHPALLDAVLGPVARWRADGRQVRLVALRDAALHATGATVLRVRLAAPGGDQETVTVTVADGAGQPVLSVDALTLSPVSVEGLGRATGHHDSLFTLNWVTLPEPAAATATTATVREVADLAALAGGDLPELVVHPVATGLDAQGTLLRVLPLIRSWVGADRFQGARLVFVTRADELAHAAVAGLLRSAQNEHADRLVLVDSDTHGDDESGLDPVDAGRIAEVLATGENQLRLRGGRLLAPRLARARVGGVPTPPESGPWRLTSRAAGTRGELAFVPLPDAGREPLGAGEVRVAVRAAGLTPAGAVLGRAGAGVVLEAGAEVTGLAQGDRVFGLLPDAVATEATADHRWLVPIPDGWSFEEAAALPWPFLVAWSALVDEADIGPEHTVLVHGGSGGIGMAAVQLARHLGAEVFTTASPATWDALRELGVEDTHLASSHSLDFHQEFAAATGGRGFDIVLNSLSGKAVNATLDLMPRGGHFLDLGGDDQSGAVTPAHSGVSYRMVEALPEESGDRIGRRLRETVALLRDGALRFPPVRALDVRQAPEALRLAGDAEHTGEVVLRPRAWDPDGTVLITGGTGTLGSLLARHLVATHGLRHPLLISRRGDTAEGATELAASLKELGAEPRIVACDAGSREAVVELLASIPADRPLRAVVHTAGIVEDGLIESLTDEQVERVLRAKVDSARHLDELTAELDLTHFVLYSSVSGLLGGVGQGNYAAANAVLDALAERRRERGQAAVSLAWGLWEDASGMTGALADSDRARVARAGLRPMPAGEALALFDAALAHGAPLVAPVQLDLATVRSAAGGQVAPLMRGLVTAPARRTAGEGSAASQAAELRARLLATPAAERQSVLTDLVREHAAVVLGFPDLTRIDAGQPFRDAGFDSLTAVELRNRLTVVTGVRLAATMVFDYSRPAELAEHLLGEMLADVEEPAGAEPGDPVEAEFRAALGEVSMAAFRDAGVLGILRRLVGQEEAGERQAEPVARDSIATMDVADLVSRALRRDKP
ncbi:type I polyketide synthase [Streptomyces profundus]|uniref:type I polyketide synthase n=1 Tax=Streptomyces profundus TaxID=2867410 RepID=UPI001D15E8BF|nr:type I polyketide synthase [Streptomyces sp. MA3_2.13]UED87412.1 SDR family NAD(P)-dependent oxidoreductase [Streptomyces sp. MA3_2.13]